jgi:hypothetical protein
MSRPRAPSSNGHTFGSPEAQSSHRTTLARSPRQPTVSQEHLMQGSPDTLS